MAGANERLAAINDPQGREVEILARVWNAKILRDHPEMTAHLTQVIDAIRCPDQTTADPRPRRRRYYRRGVEPSRWLLVVVSYEQQPARVITALATRKGPPLWRQ